MAGDKKFALRLSPDLYEVIRQRAERNNRSVNGEIVTLLKLGLMFEGSEAKALKDADHQLGLIKPLP